MIDQIHQKRWFSELLRDNQIIEVRRENSGNWYWGYFDNLKAIQRLPNQYPRDNLYTSITRFEGKAVTTNPGVEE